MKKLFLVSFFLLIVCSSVYSQVYNGTTNWQNIPASQVSVVTNGFKILKGEYAQPIFSNLDHTLNSSPYLFVTNLNEMFTNGLTLDGDLNMKNHRILNVRNQYNMGSTTLEEIYKDPTFDSLKTFQKIEQFELTFDNGDTNDPYYMSSYANNFKSPVYLAAYPRSMSITEVNFPFDPITSIPLRFTESGIPYWTNLVSCDSYLATIAFPTHTVKLSNFEGFNKIQSYVSNPQNITISGLEIKLYNKSIFLAGQQNAGNIKVGYVKNSSTYYLTNTFTPKNLTTAGDICGEGWFANKFGDDASPWGSLYINEKLNSEALTNLFVEISYNYQQFPAGYKAEFWNIEVQAHFSENYYTNFVQTITNNNLIFSELVSANMSHFPEGVSKSIANLAWKNTDLNQNQISFTYPIDLQVSETNNLGLLSYNFTNFADVNFQKMAGIVGNDWITNNIIKLKLNAQNIGAAAYQYIIKNQSGTVLSTSQWYSFTVSNGNNTYYINDQSLNNINISLLPYIELKLRASWNDYPYSIPKVGSITLLESPNIKVQFGKIPWMLYLNTNNTFNISQYNDKFLSFKDKPSKEIEMYKDLNIEGNDIYNGNITDTITWNGYNFTNFLRWSQFYHQNLQGLLPVTSEALYHVPESIYPYVSNLSNFVYHNNLYGKQGGNNSNEYFHLDSNNWDKLVNNKINHESLINMLGGSVSNHYHLNNSQYNNVVGWDHNSLSNKQGGGTGGYYHLDLEGYNIVTNFVGMSYQKHNNTTEKQGGNGSNEYFHLSSNDYVNVNTTNWIHNQLKSLQGGGNHTNISTNLVGTNNIITTNVIADFYHLSSNSWNIVISKTDFSHNVYLTNFQGGDYLYTTNAQLYHLPIGPYQKSISGAWNHETLANLLGGDGSGHYHATLNQLNQLTVLQNRYHASPFLTGWPGSPAGYHLSLNGYNNVEQTNWLHNATKSIQGGQTGEYYHLNNECYSWVTNAIGIDGSIHNNLIGIQGGVNLGGTNKQYYHSTAEEYDKIKTGHWSHTNLVDMRGNANAPTPPLNFQGIWRVGQYHVSQDEFEWLEDYQYIPLVNSDIDYQLPFTHNRIAKLGIQGRGGIDGGGTEINGFKNYWYHLSPPQWRAVRDTTIDYSPYDKFDHAKLYDQKPGNDGDFSTHSIYNWHLNQTLFNWVLTNSMGYDHNSLSNKQGGYASGLVQEFYHLRGNDYNTVVNGTFDHDKFSNMKPSGLGYGNYWHLSPTLYNYLNGIYANGYSHNNLGDLNPAGNAPWNHLNAAQYNKVVAENWNHQSLANKMPINSNYNFNTEFNHLNNKSFSWATNLEKYVFTTNQGNSNITLSINSKNLTGISNANYYLSIDSSNINVNSYNFNANSQNLNWSITNYNLSGNSANYNFNSYLFNNKLSLNINPNTILSTPDNFTISSPDLYLQASNIVPQSYNLLVTNKLTKFSTDKFVYDTSLIECQPTNTIFTNLDKLYLNGLYVDTLYPNHTNFLSLFSTNPIQLICSLDLRGNNLINAGRISLSGGALQPSGLGFITNENAVIFYSTLNTNWSHGVRKDNTYGRHYFIGYEGPDVALLNSTNYNELFMFTTDFAEYKVRLKALDPIQDNDLTTKYWITNKNIKAGYITVDTSKYDGHTLSSNIVTVQDALDVINSNKLENINNVNTTNLKVGEVLLYSAYPYGVPYTNWTTNIVITNLMTNIVITNSIITNMFTNFAWSNKFGYITTNISEFNNDMGYISHKYPSFTIATNYIVFDNTNQVLVDLPLNQSLMNVIKWIITPVSSNNFNTDISFTIYDSSVSNSWDQYGEKADNVSRLYEYSNFGTSLILTNSSSNDMSLAVNDPANYSRDNMCIVGSNQYHIINTTSNLIYFTSKVRSNITTNDLVNKVISFEPFTWYNKDTQFILPVMIQTKVNITTTLKSIMIYQ